MNYDFEQLANNIGIGNMSYALTPDALRQAGMVSFLGAEMTFPTAPSIIASLNRMVNGGLYGFTLQDRQYNDAICWWMQHARDWQISPEWILPTHGTIYAVATAIRMTTQPGEGVIVQPPVYPRYAQAIQRLGRKVVYNPLQCNAGCYTMDLEQLEACMADPANRLLVLCNPHNPVGRVWTEQELRSLGKLSAKYGVAVISDEIFGEMTFGCRCVPYASVTEGSAYAMTVVSLGKTFNFTGVNHANVIIPNAKLREGYLAQRNADHYGSVGPFEYASVLGAYCEEGMDWVRQMLLHLERNQKALHAFFDRYAPEIRCSPTEGTSVCWIDWNAWGMTGEELNNWLETQALISVEAGEDFSPGGNGFTRWNFSTSAAQLNGALERLAQAMAARQGSSL